MIEIRTRSARETKKVARMLAQEMKPRPGRAAVIALSGELGAGKTTFTQGFAQALGVKENVLSPTFVLMKIYDLRHETRDTQRKTKNKKRAFRHLAHIDCYRLASPKDLLHLGFKEILKDKDAVILVEWPERIKKILPRDAMWLKFSHGAKPHERYIEIYGGQVEKIVLA